MTRKGERDDDGGGGKKCCWWAPIAAFVIAAVVVIVIIKLLEYYQPSEVGQQRITFSGPITDRDTTRHSIVDLAYLLQLTKYEEVGRKKIFFFLAHM